MDDQPRSRPDEPKPADPSEGVRIIGAEGPDPGDVLSVRRGGDVGAEVLGDLDDRGAGLSDSLCNRA